MARRAEVESILQRLEGALQNGQRLPDLEVEAALSELKVLGRDVANGPALANLDTVKTLIVYAFDGVTSTSASYEAMRCLANAMLLHDATRQMVVDQGCCQKAADCLRITVNDDVEFLASRILFFCTYAKTIDLAAIVNRHGLAKSVAQNLKRHVASGPPSAASIAAMALAESLKLLTNVVILDPTLIASFTLCIDPISSLLLQIDVTAHPLEPPTTLLINAIMSLDLSPDKIEDADLRANLFPIGAQTALIDKLVAVLDKASDHRQPVMSGQNSRAPPEIDDTNLSSLLTLLTKLYVVAPIPVRSTIESRLLPDSSNPPSASSRSKPLGSDDSLSSRLLHLTASMNPSLADSIGTLYLELSGRSPSRLVKNIGYGYAAGYLAAHPELSTVDLDSSDETTDTGINPVTGQRFEDEVDDSGPPMTDEEKEREAERLFVLFERLKATGVVDVENPVRRAMEEGKLG